MAVADDYLKMLLNTWDELLSKFGQGWTYPERPMLVNQKYPYRLLHCNNPGDFSVLLDDVVTAGIERKVKEACEVYTKRSKEYNFSPVEMKKLAALGSNVEMVPVAVKDHKGAFYRGEINALKLEENWVYVTLVDSGVEKRVRPEDLYPPSTDLLRYPRLALICRLSQVVPVKKEGWPTNVDYKEIFMTGQTHTFAITAFQKGIYEVYLEKDDIDVGYELVMDRGIADLCPLENLTGFAKDLVIGKYPRRDFAPWVGQKLCAFGTKISRVSTNNPACGVKVHLQLDTSLANDVADKVQLYGETLQKSDPKKFAKGVGDPVIALYEGDYYRATIVEVKKAGKYKVRLVDYGDFVPLDEKDLFPISEELTNVPEASMPCYLVELLGVKLTDPLIDRVTDLVKEQNVCCRIGYTDFIDEKDISERHKYIVTLSITNEETEEKETPLADLLKLRHFEPVLAFPTKYPTISRFLAPILLSSKHQYVAGRLYEANLTCVESVDSVYVHLNGDNNRAEALTTELTTFYEYCPELGNLDPTAAKVGTYIGAQQESESDDPNWYRAVITDILPEQNKYRVKYLDYGNFDEISIGRMKPLINYFAKDQPLAVEIAIPVTLHPGVDLDDVADIILRFMEGMQGAAFLQHGDNGLLYAWLYVGEESLSDYLVKSGKGSLKLKAPIYSGK